MIETVDVLIVIMFGVCILWLGKRVYNQRKELVIAGKFFNGYRFFIIICMAFFTLPLFMMSSRPIDIVRNIMMLIIMVGFIYVQDGIGENGLLLNGSLISYDCVTKYDYKNDSKKFTLIVVTKEKTKKGYSENYYNVVLKSDKSDEIITILKDKMPKKHIRMKKS